MNTLHVANALFNRDDLRVDKILHIFNHFDDDDSGEIDKDEFKELLQVITGGIEIMEKKMEDLWLTLDLDHSGAVTFEEFLIWYFQHFGPPRASSIQKSRKMIKEMDGEEDAGGMKSAKSGFFD